MAVDVAAHPSAGTGATGRRPRNSLVSTTTSPFASTSSAAQNSKASAPPASNVRIANLLTQMGLDGTRLLGAPAGVVDGRTTPPGAGAGDGAPAAQPGVRRAHQWPGCDERARRAARRSGGWPRLAAPCWCRGHVMPEVAMLCDRVIVMAGGRHRRGRHACRADATDRVCHARGRVRAPHRIGRRIELMMFFDRLPERNFRGDVRDRRSLTSGLLYGLWGPLVMGMALIAMAAIKATSAR